MKPEHLAALSKQDLTKRYMAAVSRRTSAIAGNMLWWPICILAWSSVFYCTLVAFIMPPIGEQRQLWLLSAILATLHAYPSGTRAFASLRELDETKAEIAELQLAASAPSAETRSGTTA